MVFDRSALFLDRDGVINVDRGYVHCVDQFEFIPGIFEMARFWVNEVRRPIVVVTNQSGIGRGYFNEETYTDVTRWMCARFEAERAAIARVYHCPYHPVHGIGDYRRDHPWRKPNPGMLLQAAADLSLDPARCALVGDKTSDIEAGAAAGIGLRILLARGSGNVRTSVVPYETVADLHDALALLRSRFAATATEPTPGMFQVPTIPTLELVVAVGHYRGGWSSRPWSMPSLAPPPRRRAKRAPPAVRRYSNSVDGQSSALW
jgi:D-glycero-D-manno-heptose 1,7-bisphosphate phosphatase